MLYFIVTLIILAASFLFSMLGLGGALVYVPVLKWAGFPLKEVAIPLALLLNGLTTLIALIAFIKNKLVDWKGGAAMTITAFIFAPIGAISSEYIPVKSLLLLFSIMVLIAAARMMFMSKQPEPKSIMSFKKKSYNWCTGWRLCRIYCGLTWCWRRFYYGSVINVDGLFYKKSGGYFRICGYVFIFLRIFRACFSRSF